MNNNVFNDEYKWTPCSKRLPQHYTEVRIKLKNGEEAIGERGAFVDPFINEWQWWIKGEKSPLTNNSEVIAWQLIEGRNK